MTKFDQIYQRILKDIMTNGIKEYSERTKLECTVLPGVHFSIDPEKDGFPLQTLRKIPLKSVIAEQIWFLSGARKPEDFLRDYTKIWDAFTNPGDVVTVAYGYRWRKHFGRDQIGALIKLLQKEPSSRQGVVVTWDPGQDGLGAAKKANVPCPYTFTVNIIGGKLHLHNMVRSNDMMLGFPFDVAGFCLLQYILAQKLGVGVGIYSHSISNAHVYENHYEGAREILKRENDHPPIKLILPKNSLARAEKKDKKLLDEIFDILNKQYHPLENIGGLKIAK
ncbi:MAG TPA: thymidylate synthase [Candidatus Paceibacterota bacterium]|nr:thymidylate synthase [Candidatus Paceibacterota bacterium]HRZ34185.1 thymidylate synthase [Candidatus Paceibacterota bacterium]